MSSETEPTRTEPELAEGDEAVEPTSPEQNEVASRDRLKRLPTRRGDFYVPSYQLWSEREEIPRGAGVLKPGAKVVILGSCIAWQADLYLRRRGYQPFHSPGGYHYNPQAIRAELERVLLEQPWPLPVAMEIPGGKGFAHPFRKNIVTSSRPELVVRDDEVTKQVRAALESADVILCVIGTTIEAWASEHGGVAINEIPHPEIYNQGGWELDMGSLDSVRAEVREIQRLLMEYTTAARVYAVCPIPLYATWADQSVVTMNGRSKALMRAALEAELTDAETYLPMWDWMGAQTRRWTPTRPDGRHLDWVGIDRLMHFCERYLAEGEVPRLSRRHRLRSRLKDAAYRLKLPVP
jgi:GSCFA family